MLQTEEREIVRCINCGINPRLSDRRICITCNRERSRKQKRGSVNCFVCKKKVTQYRKNQVFCFDCLNSIGEGSKATHNYPMIGNRTVHSIIAEILLGHRVGNSYVIHHLDENPCNNDVRNLIVLRNGKHTALRVYLRIQKAIMKYSGCEYSDEYWESIKIGLTFDWLEDNNVNIIKLWEIGNNPILPERSVRIKKVKLPPKPPHRKVVWPTKEELEILLWQKPTSHIARDYGVSDNAVAKWAKLYGLSKPPRGYWEKLYHKNVKQVDTN